jgi:hypothetical protein
LPKIAKEVVKSTPETLFWHFAANAVHSGRMKYDHTDAADQQHRIATNLLGLALYAFKLTVAFSGYSERFLPPDEDLRLDLVAALSQDTPVAFADMAGFAVRVGHEVAVAFIEDADQWFAGE